MRKRKQAYLVIFSMLALAGASTGWYACSRCQETPRRITTDDKESPAPKSKAPEQALEIGTGQFDLTATQFDRQGPGEPPEIKWLTDYEKALNRARFSDKLVVIYFYADWCEPCHWMDDRTFADPEVRNRTADFIPLKIDSDKHPQLFRRYRIVSIPTTLVINADGLPVTGTSGFLDAHGYLEVLATATSEHRQKPGVLGQPAPDLGVTTWFNLPQGQDSLDVTNFRGKVLYLFAFQSWCPGCHSRGFPTLAKLIDHFKNNDNVAFLAVQTVFEGFNTNTPPRAKETADRYHLAIPIGHSGSAQHPSTFMSRYRTGGTPWTVIIDRRGRVRYNDFHLKPEAGITLIEELLKN